jgi:O-antigen/teichoic acid export membrane protein
VQANLKAKLLRNLGANAYGQLITIVIQLVSVPLYLHYWGVELYGEWLILSAIPAYLALSDIGFASAAANEMTIKYAQGDRKGVLRVYQSIWLFISSISALVGCVLALIIYAVPLTTQFSISHISEYHTKLVLAFFVLYVLLGLQGNVLNAAFRSAGKYAYGTASGNTVRLAEWAASILIIVMGGDVVDVAVATLATRLIGMMILWRVLNRQVNWLYFGNKAASLQQIRDLFKPAIAFMAFPLGLAIGLQGMVLIIGVLLGPAAVVIFSAYRTITRLLVQLTTMMNHAAWPEISAAYGGKDLDLIRRLHRKGAAMTLIVALCALPFLGFLGEWFVGIWTHHAFEQNHLLFAFLLASGFLNVLWQTSWVVMMATNHHQNIIVAFIVFPALALLASVVLIPVLGINGAAIILAVSEIPMLYVVTNSALKLLADKWPDYIKSILNNPFH